MSNKSFLSDNFVFNNFLLNSDYDIDFSLIDVLLLPFLQVAGGVSDT